MLDGARSTAQVLPGMKNGLLKHIACMYALDCHGQRHHGGFKHFLRPSQLAGPGCSRAALSATLARRLYFAGTLGWSARWLINLAYNAAGGAPALGNRPRAPAALASRS